MAALVVLGLSLSACGQKGPLTLVGTSRQTATTVTAAATATAAPVQVKPARPNPSAPTDAAPSGRPWGSPPL